MAEGKGGAIPAKSKSAAVLSLLRGDNTIRQVSERYDVSEAEVRRWKDDFLESAQRAFNDHRPSGYQNKASGRTRRKGPDLLVGAVSIFSALSWGLAIGAIAMVDKAGPRVLSASDKIAKSTGVIPHTAGWDDLYLRISVFLMGGILTACFGGLLLNSRRMKREEDRWNRSLIVLGLLSFCSLLFMAYWFGADRLLGY
jgi:transposase-like protein